MYWYFKQNQCLSIKKHAVDSMHRLAWGHYARGAPNELPSVPMRYDGTGLTCKCLSRNINLHAVGKEGLKQIYAYFSVEIKTIKL